MDVVRSLDAAASSIPRRRDYEGLEMYIIEKLMGMTTGLIVGGVSV